MYREPPSTLQSALMDPSGGHFMSNGGSQEGLGTFGIRQTLNPSVLLQGVSSSSPTARVTKVKDEVCRLSGKDAVQDDEP